MSALLLLLALLLAPFTDTEASNTPPAATTAADPPTATGTAEPPAQPYVAGGTEPFWGLSIINGRFDFELNTTEIVYAGPAPVPERTPRGYIYRTPRLVAEIWREECTDVSEHVFADTVRITVDGRHLDGCGDTIRRPESFRGTGWRVIEIGGRPVDGPVADLYILGFERETVYLGSPCGAFSGAYSVEAERLAMRLAPSRFRGVETPEEDEFTRTMTLDPEVCTNVERDRQSRLLQILGGPVTLRWTSEGQYIVTGESGALKLAEIWN